MAFLKDLKVRLGLDNKKFKSGLKQSTKATNQFSKSIQKIGGMVAGAFATSKIVSFFKTSFKLYGIQEKAERSLAAAIENNGKQVNSTLADYKRFASELQNATTIGDEMTLQMLQLAESMGSLDAKGAVKQAVGLSKALNIDLRTALRGVILAQEGEFTMLNRYIPALRSANTETEKRAALEKAAAAGMRIATDEIKTQTGQLEQLSNAFGDFQEGIGKLISDGGEATGVTNKLTQEFGDMSEVLKNDSIPWWARLGSLITNNTKGLIKYTKEQQAAAKAEADRNTQIVNSLNLEGKTVEQLRAQWLTISQTMDTAYKQVAFPAIQQAIQKLQGQKSVQLGLIEGLEKEIAEKQKLLKIADSKKAINKINDETAALKAQLKALTELRTKEEMTAPVKGTAISTPQLTSEALTLPIKITGDTSVLQRMPQQYLTWKDSIDETSQAMSAFGTISSSVGSIMQATGAQGSASWIALGATVLGEVAKMIPVLYNQAIGGIVANGAAAPWWLAPVVIASGIATVASAFAGIGGGSSGRAQTTTYGTPSSQTSSDTTRQQTVTVEGVVKGADLYLINQKEAKRRGR